MPLASKLYKNSISSTPCSIKHAMPKRKLIPCAVCTIHPGKSNNFSKFPIVLFWVGDFLNHLVNFHYFGSKAVSVCSKYIGCSNLSLLTWGWPSLLESLEHGNCRLCSCSRQIVENTFKRQFHDVMAAIHPCSIFLDGWCTLHMESVFWGAVGAFYHAHWMTKTIYRLIKLLLKQQLFLVKNSTAWRSWQSLWALSMSNPALVWSPTAYKHTVEWPAAGANQRTCEIPKHDHNKSCINFGFLMNFGQLIPPTTELVLMWNRWWLKIFNFGRTPSLWNAWSVLLRLIVPVYNTWSSILLMQENFYDLSHLQCEFETENTKLSAKDYPSLEPIVPVSQKNSIFSNGSYQQLYSQGNYFNVQYSAVLNIRISKIAFCVWCKKTVEKVGYPSYSKTGHTGEDDVPNAKSWGDWTSLEHP